MNIKKIVFASAIAFCLSASIALAAFPVSPALFDTSLASPQGTSDTTLTMVTAPNLFQGDYVCIAVDSGLTTLEYECGTASTTSGISPQLVNLTRGLNFRDGSTTVSANIFSHRSGADVRITTFPILAYMTQTFIGSSTFPNVLSYSNAFTVSTTSLQIPYASWINNLGSYWANLASTSAQSLSLNGSNTYTGINTYSSTPIFNAGATFNSFLPTSSVTPTSPTQLTTKTYVDSVALQGAPVSGNNATGTVMLATGLQAASSTVSKGYANAAPYVIPSAISTSTWNSSGSLQVVVTNNYNKIDSNFISTTTVFSTVGANTWTKPSGYHFALVLTIGGGQNGANGSNGGGGHGGAGGGGGASGYMNAQYLDLDMLPPTVSITVGGAAATSSFGAYVSAPGATTTTAGQTGGSPTATSSSLFGIFNTGIWYAGTGGNGGNYSGNNGGQGGSGASINVNGATGTDGSGSYNSTTTSSGYNSYLGSGGEGGQGGLICSNGVNATTYGAGGGGGGGGSNGGCGPGTGGLGAQGAVVITLY